MKKTVALVLGALLILSAVFAVQGAVAPTTAAAATNTPVPQTETAEEKKVEQEAQTATHDPAYGEPLSIETDADGFSATIAYPSGFEPVDNALETWANKLIKQYETAAKKLTANADGQKGELFVSYNSYETIGRFIGVEEVGVYTPADGSAEGVLYTVNYDSKTEKILTIDNVIDPKHQDAVGAMLALKISESGRELLKDKAAASKTELQSFVVTDTGVRFLFLNGADVYAYDLSYDLITDYLILFADEASAATPTPVPAAVDKPDVVCTAVCTHNGVHVRAEANAKATLIATVQAGAELEVTKQDAGNGWTEVWYNDAPAYIAARYLKFEAADAADEQPVSMIAGYISTNGVHVRAEASSKSQKLGTLHDGDKVEIVTPYYTNNWDQIWYNGALAYVCAQYVHVGDEPAATPKPAEVQAEIVGGPPRIAFVGTCTTNGVIVRSDTSIHSDYYSKLYEGDEVQVMNAEYRSGWDRVWIPTNNSNTRGYIGFVHSKYIEDYSQVVPVAQATPKPVIPVIQVTPTPVPVIPVIPNPALVTGNTGPVSYGVPVIGQ